MLDTRCTFDFIKFHFTFTCTGPWCSCQAVEASGFRMHGHEFDSRIWSSLFSFFYFYFFVSQIRDNGPVRDICMELKSLESDFKPVC